MVNTQTLKTLLMTLFVVFGSTSILAGTQSMDDHITDAVIGEIKAEPTMNTAKIKVHTEKGTVILKGTVESKKQEEIAIKLAKSVKEVKKVKSKLTISSGDAKQTMEPSQSNGKTSSTEN